MNTMESLPKQDNMLTVFKNIIKHKIKMNLTNRFNNIDTRLIFQNNLK